MKALEKQSLIADRAAVVAMLERIPQDDPLGRMSFDARLAEIDERLQALEQQQDHLGSVALIFNGEPVTGSRSIDAIFASDVLKSFQDLITKRIAVEEIGELGARGPLPIRVRTGLGVANIVRGSVGFLLEEQAANAALADTVLKHAIDEITVIIEKAASDEAEVFEEAVQAIDSRLLVSLRAFFKTLDEGQAQVRIVESERDAKLNTIDIRRARDRLENTEIEERDNEVVIGELLGLLPDGRRFEMRLADGGQHIRGAVASRVAERYLELIEQPGAGPVGRWWRARMKIREIRERNRPPRIQYTLLGLVEEVAMPRQPDL